MPYDRTVNTTNTHPHRRLRAAIQSLGYRYTEEYAVGKYSLDFYLPEFNVGLEADGPIHRTKVKKDRARDTWIYENTGITVIRFPVYAVHQVELVFEVREKLDEFIQKATGT